MATFSSGVKCSRSFLIRSLRYLNGRTLSPFPTEAEHQTQALQSGSDVMYLVEATTLRFEHPQKLTNRYSIDTTPLFDARGQPINLFGNPHHSFSSPLASNILAACCRRQIRTTGLRQTL